MSNEEDGFALLRQMPVFGGLSNSALAFILDRSGVIEVTANQHFFREGDAAKSFFVLQTGTVVIEKDWEGLPVELQRMGAGDCIGEMAIIDLQSRSASVRAVADCLAIEITRVTLNELYQTDLEQFAIIMMNMGREVSRRLRIASDRLFTIDQTVPE